MSGKSTEDFSLFFQTAKLILNIKFALPPQAGNIAASTLIRGAALGQVKIILQIRQPGSADNKAFTIIKTVEVVSGKAETTISSLPAGLVIVKLRLENSHIEGWRDFHGANDLKTGVTTDVEVSPPGSRLPADLLATAMQEAIKNDTIMAAAGSSVATNLLTAVKQIDVNSENLYSKVFDTLIEQIAPAGMVKIVFDNSARTLTAYNGSVQVWQQPYATILGSSQIAGITPTALQVIRVARQGFDN